MERPKVLSHEDIDLCGITHIITSDDANAIANSQLAADIAHYEPEIARLETLVQSYELTEATAQSRIRGLEAELAIQNRARKMISDAYDLLKQGATDELADAKQETATEILTIYHEYNAMDYRKFEAKYPACVGSLAAHEFSDVVKAKYGVKAEKPEVQE